MKTTFKKIKSFHPCNEGWGKLIKHHEPKSLTEEISIAEILKSNGIKDAVWALKCLSGDDLNKAHLFCADVAESVLHFFENKYPDDNRPKNAINAIRRYVKGEITKEDLLVYAEAAKAAAVNADAVWAVYADAASSAASSAASAAASTSASSAASVYAISVVYAAADADAYATYAASAYSVYDAADADAFRASEKKLEEITKLLERYF